MTVGVVVAVMAGLACQGRAPVAAPIQTAYAIPDGPDRVIADVLNGTGVGGRARVITQALRRQGIDVVFYGDTSARPASTLILVRRGNGDPAKKVRVALGRGQIVAAPDSMRRVDVTVVIGRDSVPR